MIRRQFASPGFDLHHQLRGKKSGGAPDGSVPPGRRGVPRRIVCATARPLHAGCPNVRRSPHCSVPRQPAGLFWHAEPENTATYTWRPAFVAQRPPPSSNGSCKGSSSAWRHLSGSHHATEPVISATENTLVYLLNGVLSSASPGGSPLRRGPPLGRFLDAFQIQLAAAE